MAKKTKDSNLSIEERLEQALIPNWDEPYKLPENWCWVKLSSISMFERGITFPASAKESLRTTTNIPCLRTANVQESLELDDLLYVDRSYVKDNPNKLVRENDIIMSTANSRELVGKTSFVHSLTEEMTFGGFIMAIRSKIDPKYLFYFLRLQFLNGKFMSNSTQTTNIANINSATLGETETPIPPLEEQKRIVVHIETLFAKLDEAKEKAQEVVDGFETRKAAILHKAFSGELTAKWREENNISFEDWENRPLSQIATVVSGFAFSSSDFNPQNTVPCIKITNVGVGEYLSDEYEFLPEAYLNGYEKFIVNKGDILISLTRSYINAGLKVCISEETKPSLLNQRVAMIKNCNIRYIYYFLRSDKVLSYVKEKSKTTNQPNLSIKDLNNLIVPIAGSDEQLEIVKLLDYFFAKEQQAKETAEAVIEQIDTIKKAILARAFRGELGTNDPCEESAVELLKQII